MRDQGDQRQLGILLTYLSSAYTLREDSMVIAYNVIDFDYFLGSDSRTTTPSLLLTLAKYCLRGDPSWDTLGADYSTKSTH